MPPAPAATITPDEAVIPPLRRAAAQRPGRVPGVNGIAGPRSIPSMKCYALTLGARNTPAAGRHFSTHDEGAIRQVTQQHFPDGFTITAARGGWWDQDAGRFKLEDSRQITVRSPSRPRVQRWARALGALLQQKELLVVELGESLVIRPRARVRSKP